MILSITDTQIIINPRLELYLIIIKAILLPEILNNKMKDFHIIKLKLDLSDDI